MFVCDLFGAISGAMYGMGLIKCLGKVYCLHHRQSVSRRNRLHHTVQHVEGKHSNVVDQRRWRSPTTHWTRRTTYWWWQHDRWSAEPSYTCRGNGALWPRAVTVRSAHALMTLLTWSLIDSFLVTVTPRILSDVARCIPGNGDGAFTWRRRFPPVNTISMVLGRISVKLFVCADASMFCSSAVLESVLLSGI